MDGCDNSEGGGIQEGGGKPRPYRQERLSQSRSDFLQVDRHFNADYSYGATMPHRDTGVIYAAKASERIYPVPETRGIFGVRAD